MTIGLRDVYGVSQIGVLGGGTAGQTLIKQSATDGDFQWEDPSSGGPITEFDTTVAYAAGDMVTKDGEIFTAIAPSPAGAFNEDNWASIAARKEVPINVDFTGDLIGLDYHYKGTHEITISPGLGKSSDGQTDILLPQEVDLTIPSDADKLYHIFVCSDGTPHATEFMDGSDLSCNHKRWIGLVLNDNAGELISFNFFNDSIVLDSGIEIATRAVQRRGGCTTGRSEIKFDLSTVFPIDKITGVGGTVRVQNVTSGHSVWADMYTDYELIASMTSSSYGGFEGIKPIFSKEIKLGESSKCGEHGTAWYYIKGLSLRR